MPDTKMTQDFFLMKQEAIEEAERDVADLMVKDLLEKKAQEFQRTVVEPWVQGQVNKLLTGFTEYSGSSSNPTFNSIQKALDEMKPIRQNKYPPIFATSPEGYNIFMELEKEKSPETPSWYGVPLIIEPSLSSTMRVQFRFPRTKKKRIQKKWAKDHSNWRTVQDDTIYMFNAKSLDIFASFEQTVHKSEIMSWTTPEKP